MILGGLDIATVTGAAVMKNGIITAETIKIPAPKKKFLERDEKDPPLNAVELGKAFEFFRGAIRVWLIENKIEYLAIEEPIRTDFQRTKTTIDTDSQWAGKAVKKEKVMGTPLKTVFKIHGLESVACMLAAEMNIPTVFVNQATWRKAFLGNGRPPDAKKEAKKMCERMKIAVTSLDAAEACGVCFWLNTHLNPLNRAGTLFAQKPKPLTPAQEDAKAAAEALFRKEA
jgi:hypothetical protein